MNSRIPCEFSLIRYVPDVVKGEFTNIGVVLREVSPESLETPEDIRKAVTQVRFTRDWRRVRCIDPDADTDLLESLEDEIARLLLEEATGPLPSKPLLSLLSDTLSNSVQITEPRATLAESFALELETAHASFTSSPFASRSRANAPGAPPSTRRCAGSSNAREYGPPCSSATPSRSTPAKATR